MSTAPIRRRKASSIRPVSSLALTCLLLASGVTQAPAQSREFGGGFGYDDSFFEGMKWREVGPFRGGRSAACAGHTDQPRTYYMGACGGGVWKTEDAGATWKNISDGSFGGSIGAVENTGAVEYFQARFNCMTAD